VYRLRPGCRIFSVAGAAARRAGVSASRRTRCPARGIGIRMADRRLARRASCGSVLSRVSILVGVGRRRCSEPVGVAAGGSAPLWRPHAADPGHDCRRGGNLAASGSRRPAACRLARSRSSSATRSRPLTDRQADKLETFAWDSPSCGIPRELLKSARPLPGPRG
jgi:hypothetical protein